jgi:hypothetical protein
MQDGFHSRNSVPNITATHLQMMTASFDKYYSEHEDRRGQNMWTVSAFAEHKA